MAKTGTKPLSVRIPLSLAKKVNKLAARLERPRGWIVQKALTAWVTQEEDRYRLTREGLADVDAGHVIDHRTVQAWADSLETERPRPAPR